MSGAEVIAVLGLGASILQLIDTSKRVIDRVKKYQQSIAFEDLVPQLQLFLTDIEKLRASADLQSLQRDEETVLVRVLKGCERQLTGLEAVIQGMQPPQNASKLHRTWRGIRSFGKDSKIREFLDNLNQYRSTISFHLTSHMSTMTHDRFQLNESAIRFEIPARQISNFVGRTDLLQELKNAIHLGSPSKPDHQRQIMLNKPIVLVITGLGGQGKSQLTMRLWEEISSDFRGIFWIDATSKQSATADIERYVRLLSKQTFSGSTEKVVEYFKNTLFSWEHPWMIVFDNYDIPRNFQDLATLFPTTKSPNGSFIVVTSRSNDSHRLGMPFELGGLTMHDSLDLLFARFSKYQHIDDEDRAAGGRIVEKLGHLPLAIDQASAYLSARRMPCKIFEAEYDNRKAAILAHTPDSLWEYQKSNQSSEMALSEVNLSAFTTWECSFEQVTEDKSIIEDMLTQVAFLNESGIGENLLRNFAESGAHRIIPSWVDSFLQSGQWDSARFQDIIIGLLSMSLIQGVQYEKQGLSFSLHPVVKDWLQLRVESEKRQENTNNALLIMSHHVSSINIEITPFEDRHELLKHVDACQLNVQQFLTTDETRQTFGGYVEGHQTIFATFYAKNDRVEAATRLYMEIVAMQEHVLGLADLATLATMNNLGTLLLSRKHYKNAFRILDTVLKEKEKILPPGHKRVLNTINNLGNVCTALGQYDRAQELFTRALDAYRQDTGTKQRSYAAVYNNLGEVELAQSKSENGVIDFNRVGSAQRYFHKALSYGRTSLGSDASNDEVVCHILENLAKIYEAQGQVEDAIHAQTQAATALRKLLGETNPRTVSATVTLGAMSEHDQSPSADTLRERRFEETRWNERQQIAYFKGLELVRQYSIPFMGSTISGQALHNTVDEQALGVAHSQGIQMPQGVQRLPIMDDAMPTILHTIGLQQQTQHTAENMDPNSPSPPGIQMQQTQGSQQLQWILLEQQMANRTRNMPANSQYGMPIMQHAPGIQQAQQAPGIREQQYYAMSRRIYDQQIQGIQQQQQQQQQQPQPQRPSIFWLQPQESSSSTPQEKRP